MRRALLILAAAGLVACEPAAMRLENAELQFEAGFSEDANLAPAPARKRAEQSEPSGTFLAYRYGYGIELPVSSVKATADKHMQVCQDAGPTKCQVMGSNANAYSEDDVRANLSLRAEPEWLKSFVADMRQDIETAKGRLASSNTSVEDLTRSILDTDARLKAQTTLRTRLEGLLETRNAELPDLLALERELARVQGEIESATANLKALRARVSMSVVDISYSSQRQAVTRGAFSPISDALKDFMRTLSQGLSGVIYFFASILPWLIFVVIPGLSLLRWFWRRRKTA